MATNENKGAVNQPLDKSSSEFIHIMVVVDTDYILSHYSSLSKDSKNPTMINAHCIYAVVSSNAAISGTQGTATLRFKAYTGDAVRVTSSSEYNNIDNPILLYNISKLSGTTVLTDFDSNTLTRVAVEPGGDSVPLILPPKFKEQDFWYFQADVSSKGTESFTFWFALYERVRGQKDPELVGYFKWDPSIQVDY